MLQGDRLLVSNGCSVYAFDLDRLAADPDSYEPRRLDLPAPARELVAGDRVVALSGDQLLELDFEGVRLTAAKLAAKHIAGGLAGGRLAAVGAAGEIFLLSGSLAEERRFERPQELADAEVKSVAAVGEWGVLVAVEPLGKAKPYMDLYYVDVSSTAAPWVQFVDPTRPRARQPSALLTAALHGWDEDLLDLVIVGNAVSADLGALGRLQQGGPVAAFFLATEEFLPQLPVSAADTRADQYPMGLALDFTNPEPTVAAPPYPPSPVLWILTNEGTFCGFRVIKSNSRTRYRQMDLAATEFPNIFKRGAAGRAAGGAPAPTCTPIDFARLPTGVEQADFGRYTNALVLEFLGIHKMVQNDISQLRTIGAQTGEAKARFAHAHAQDLRLLERDTLRLAQECDNPAFLEAHERSCRALRMAHELALCKHGAAGLAEHAARLARYTAELEAYHGSFGAAVEYLEEKAGLLEVAKRGAEQPARSVAAMAASARSLQEALEDLEHSMGLLRLSGLKVGSRPASSSKPAASAQQVARCAARLRLRKPADCLSTLRLEGAVAFGGALEGLARDRPRADPAIEAGLRARVFPVYREEDFAARDEPRSPEPAPEVDLVLSEASVSGESASGESASVEPLAKEDAFEEPLFGGVAFEEPASEESASEGSAPRKTESDEFAHDEPASEDNEAVPRLAEPGACLPAGFGLSTAQEHADASVLAEISGGQVVYTKDTRAGDREEPTAADPPAGSVAAEIRGDQVVYTEVRTPGGSLQAEQSVPEPACSEGAAGGLQAEEDPRSGARVANEAAAEFTVVPEVAEDDVSMHSSFAIDQEPALRPADSLGFMSISEAPVESRPAQSLFGVPSFLADVPRPAPTSAAEGSARAPAAGFFAPRPAESAFASRPLPGSGQGTPSGQPASSGQSAFGQSSFGQSAFGQSAFGQAALGQASSGQSSFGQSSFGQSSFGQSSFGQSAFGQSAFGQPSAFGTPATPGALVSSTPAFGSPGFGQPAFGSATFGSPTVPATFGSPAAPSTPAFGSPGFGQAAAPAKVFGQGSNLAAAAPGGFGHIASSAPSVFGEAPGPAAPPKKSLPPSFTQFRD